MLRSLLFEETTEVGKDEIKSSQFILPKKEVATSNVNTDAIPVGVIFLWSDDDTATDSTGAGNGGGANNKQYLLIELQQIYFNETDELIRFKNPNAKQNPKVLR